MLSFKGKFKKLPQSSSQKSTNEIKSIIILSSHKLIENGKVKKMKKLGLKNLEVRIENSSPCGNTFCYTHDYKYKMNTLFERHTIIYS